MSIKTVYLETIGCQMNVLDSELVLGMLRADEYVPINKAEQADLVLINTCSVRQHAEEKAYAHLGSLRQAKQHRAGMIIGVIGCTAERDPERILERCPHVDLLCGPNELHKLPDLIAEVREHPNRRATALSGGRTRRTPPFNRADEHDDLEKLAMYRPAREGQSAVQAYVRVQRGCDKLCAFCVVPFTRGRERCRPALHIIDEVKRLADGGVRQVTLLGQTVNSYGCQEDGHRLGLADLLARAQDVSGIERIRFITSYPGDFDDEIFDAMRCMPKVCEYLHIPAQSGSNEVLRRMRRRYTAEAYLELIDRARDRVPGITLAGDFIVGFPGETDDDFAQTVEIVRRVEYKNIFCFKYSPRPGTAASRRFRDDVPEQIKRRRNVELLRVQEKISLRNNQRHVGQIVDVLVEGYSKAALKAQQRDARAGKAACGSPRGQWQKPEQLTGRSRGDQIVVFEGPACLVGQLVPIQITSATALTLHGRPAADL